MTPSLVDTHCHLAFEAFDPDRGEVVARARAAGVAACVVVAVDHASALAARRLAAAEPGWAWPTAGIHPTEEAVADGAEWARVSTLLAGGGFVAVGETGLDYYRLPEPLDWQRQRFRAHIRAARASGKPLIIHTRAAAEDTLRIMREEGADAAGGVMHCFTESLDVARAAIDLGFYVSFSGIVTFKNARELQAVARALPLERLLIETDAPYLAPVPFRGRTNEPALVPHVAAKLAELHAVSIEHVASVTCENFSRCFNFLGGDLDAK